MKVKQASQKRRDGEWLALRRAGVSAVLIARRYKVYPQTVNDGILRARLAESPVGPERHPRPSLVTAYGSSCKALGVLQCRDVHPCRRCEAKGCLRCNWTGLSKIPRDSAICCGVCYKSGCDHWRFFRPHPSDPKRERKPAEKPAKLPRRQRRAKGAA